MFLACGFIQSSAPLWAPPLKGCQISCVLLSLSNSFLCISLNSKQERKESVAHVY